MICAIEKVISVVWISHVLVVIVQLLVEFLELHDVSEDILQHMLSVVCIVGKFAGNS